MLDFKQPVTFLFWTLGIIVVAICARIGWEIGEKIWGIF